MFDARHPAPGVKVYPAPTRQPELGSTQSRNRWRIETHLSWRMLRPTYCCEPTNLGLPSTPKTARSPRQPIVLQGCAPGTVRPGSRRRGHAVGPCNKAFCALLPTQGQILSRCLAALLEDLAHAHAKLIAYKGQHPDPAVEARYERKRARIIQRYHQHVPDLEGVINALEDQHVRLFGRKAV